MNFERKVGIKGQVVIPKEIRKITGIDVDSEVLVTVEGGIVLIKKPTSKLSEMVRELAKKYGKPSKKIDLDKEYEKQIMERFK